MNNGREKLGSRLGFLLLSAGCAIGCGNVWKFPWMTGQYGGGGFVLVYILCLLLLGLPAMTMEFAMGRASQKSPVKMYQVLEKPGQKWHIHGYVALLGNIALMAFYTVVTGWMMYYFVMFLTGKTADLGFVGMITNPGVNVIYLAVAVALGFLVLSFDLQGGLERVTKYMMVALFVLMIVLAGHSATLGGAKEGLKFYLVPDFSKINGSVIVGAMNQAFFSLSIGIGSMAIFGSYIGKERSLMGESVNVILMDTFVAIMAGFIMFPACFTYGIEVNAGPSLLFDTMATVFNNMGGGRFWGSLFFLFMTFAAMSTVIAVFENLIACICDLTGWERKSVIKMGTVAIIVLSLPCIFGFNIWSSFQPLGKGTGVLDLEDFVVSNNLLPLGSLVYLAFCTSRYGWGWDNFIKEADTGNGVAFPKWLRFYLTYLLPLVVLYIFVQGYIAIFGH